MPSGIAPLSGLRGFVDTNPEATAEERSGGVADPKHGAAGEVARPFPYERSFPGSPHGPYGLDNQLLGDDEWYCYTEPAGQLWQDPTADETPITHAAPWPKGLPNTTDPDEAALRAQESDSIHGDHDTGGWREMAYIPTANPAQADWNELWEVDPGQESRRQELPKQAKANGAFGQGWGQRDRQQSLAAQNEYGFDSAHMHRRVVTPGGNSLPGNYMWMQPGSRPLVKSIPGTAGIPVGADSPHYGQDWEFPYNAQGAVLMDLPAAYTAPPEPALSTAMPPGPEGTGVSQESPTDWNLW